MFSKRKKAVLIILVSILVLRICYIMAGDIDKNYYTSPNIELKDAQQVPCINVIQKFLLSKQRLNSIELVFDSIANDKKGKINIAINADNTLVYQSAISLKNLNNLEWKRIYVNIPIDHNKQYELILNAEGYTQIPNLLLTNTDLLSESLESYSDGIKLEGKIALKYGYLQEPTLFNKIISSAIWVGFFVCLLICLEFSENIKKVACLGLNRLFRLESFGIIIIISELILSLIIINSSGIPFQEPTKIVMYIISIFCAWKFKDRYDYIKSLIGKVLWKKLCLFVVYFYGTFALVGQRTLIYPLNMKITCAGIFVLICTLCWVIPVVNTFICCYCKLSERVIKGNKYIQTPKLVFWLIIFLIFPAVLCLYAYNPGISTPDTYDTMVTNAHSIFGMYDWHPAFYCMFLKLILMIWDSTYAVIIVQYLIWLYIMLEGLLFLRKKKLNDYVLLAIAAFSGINVGNFLHLNTIWKDIPHALMILWICIILSKLASDFEEYKKKSYIYMELTIALIGLFFFRKNGVVTFFIVVAAMAIILRKNIKVWITLAVSSLLIFTIKGPIYNYFEIEDPGKHGVYIGLSQDILGVYYAGGDVSERTMQMINVMTGYNNAEYSYTPTWSRQSYDLDVDMGEFILNYIDTFIKNPITMIRAVIAREDAIWNIYMGQDTVLGCVNRIDTQDGKGEWNKYYPERRLNSFFNSMYAFTSYSANNQWINSIEWRSSLLTFLSLVTMFTILAVKGAGKYMIVFVPVVGHILSLILSCGWSDFRYFWPLNLMNFYILFYMLIILNKGDAANE